MAPIVPPAARQIIIKNLAQHPIELLRAPLRHTYFTVRHGQSKANVAGILVSNVEEGCGPLYGLTEKGHAQARAAGELLKAVPTEGRPWVVATSDFTRARETAEGLNGTLRASSFMIAPELRERFFGDIEGSNLIRAQESGEHAGRPTTDATEKEKGQGQGKAGTGLPKQSVLERRPSGQRLPVDDVWDADREDPSNKFAGAESVCEVQERMMRLIARLEAELPAPSCVALVSHGDPIKILQCAFAGEDLRNFLEYWVGNCEVRELVPGSKPRKDTGDLVQ
eukprot:tig00001095_g7027.t1